MFSSFVSEESNEAYNAELADIINNSIQGGGKVHEVQKPNRGKGGKGKGRGRGQGRARIGSTQRKPRPEGSGKGTRKRKNQGAAEPVVPDGEAKTPGKKPAKGTSAGGGGEPGITDPFAV